MASTCGFFCPPTFVLVATPSGGSVQNFETPTTRSPAPRVKRVSVMLGIKLTILLAGSPSSKGRPNAS